MAETKVEQPISFADRLKRWVVPAMILLMAVAIVFVIAGNWNVWPARRPEQENGRRLHSRGLDALEHESRRPRRYRRCFRLSKRQSR